MGKHAARRREAAVLMPICSSSSQSAPGLDPGRSGGPQKSQMLLDPALVLGLPGQSLDQAMDKMQGEILQGNVHFLVLTTSAS